MRRGPKDFYPRSPCGERRPTAGKRAGCNHFYPRSPCGERQTSLVVIGTNCVISIHALLAESDRNIYNICRFQLGFLSTLSLRRATGAKFHDPRKILISIHALLAESDQCHRRQPRRLFISIHALLAESDRTNKLAFNLISPFLSTLSLRRATRRRLLPKRGHWISIHALLAESDGTSYSKKNPLRNFYPRSPCGERHVACSDWYKLRHFYPRSPCGERRNIGSVAMGPPTISIHALLAESDDTAGDLAQTVSDFYPRSPCGERRRTGGRCCLIF